MKYTLAALAVAGCASLCGCASKPAGGMASVRKSEAYQQALKSAFADLNQNLKSRTPAADDPDFKFSQNFRNTQRFAVEVFPKAMKPGIPLAPKNFKRRELSTSRRVEGKGFTYLFRKNKTGACALGQELVPEAEMENCIQFEIKPKSNSQQSAQYIRLFLNPDFRVFGLSYHEYRPGTQNFASARSQVKWDPSEPLSSETLSLAREAVPLDLPIHASNGIERTAETYKIRKGARTGSTCPAYRFKYKNTYGSRVTAHWCVSDPWPTEVETSTYHAYLTEVF